jgi:hypothetical protein
VGRCRGLGLLCRGSRWLLIEGRRQGAPRWLTVVHPCSWLARLAGFGQGFDDLFAEGGNVCGFATGDEVAVLDDLFVDPVGAGIFQIGVDGGPGGDGLALDDAGFDQTPGTVTDGGYGFSGFDKLFDEGYGVFVGAELVGVDLASGKNQGVVVVGVNFGDEVINLDGLAPVGLVPALDLAGFDGENVDFCSCSLEISLGVGEFDLLVAVGGKDGYLFTLDG